MGIPRDFVAWSALALSAVALALALTRARSISEWATGRPRRVVLALAVVAAALSVGYVAHYLRGGPRIIDATSYYLEARGFARGFLAIPNLFPSGSFRGRFLIASPDAASFAVLFPPGYPAILALGFVLGAPLAVGPAIGAALVAATYALGLELSGRRDVALGAALLSVLSAALRYHTADTMSHGLSALLAVIAIVAALRAKSHESRALFISGLSSGWLCATRPVTGAVIVLFALFVARRSASARPWASFGAFAIGLVPGIALWFAHRHAASAAFFASTHDRYYALADGPPGCFRYGFGSGIGCLFEHGEFVRKNLPSGYGVVESLGTTGRRLWHHVTDIANVWPIALVVPWFAWSARSEARVRLVTLLVMALVVAYMPFYFDGNYPGGGARLLAEAIPFEHVLIAWALCRLGWARFAPAAALAGFALVSSRGHEALAAREGGRPMFEPAVLANAGVRAGLVFADTDHGYLLGHVPGASDPRRELVVARRRGDAHDFVLWSRLGRPAAYEYRYTLDGSVPPALVPYEPPPSFHYEAEAEWPPLSVSDGWAHPDYPPAGCANGRPALRLRGGVQPVRIELEITPSAPGPYRLILRWIHVGDAPARASASIRPAGPHWESGWEAKPGECVAMPGPIVSLDGPTRLEVGSAGEALALDRIDLVSDPGGGVSPRGPIEPIRKGVDN